QALRGLDDGLSRCNQLLRSRGIDAPSRRRLLDIHGSNEPCNIGVTAAFDAEQTTSTTTWLFLGATLWLLRSYWMCATAAALVLLISWLRRLLRGVLDRRWLKAFESRNAVSVVTVVTPDGALQEVDPRSLVPGDLFLLGPGDRVPCDAVVVSGSCLVEQGDVCVPPLVAKWQLDDDENGSGETFCAAKHRASTLLCGSTVLKVRRGDVIRVVALRTGAATLQASLLRQRMRREDPLQSLVHALLFPPRSLLLAFLLESCFRSALTSAGVRCRYDVLASTQRWGSARAVAIDAKGALCGPAETLAGLLPAGSCRRLHVLQRLSQHGIVSAVLFRADRRLEVLVVGWPAAVLSLCQGRHDTHPPPPDTDPVAASLHERGLGLSAVAWKPADGSVENCDDLDHQELLAQTIETDLNFEGFLLFEAVPRSEAVTAVEAIRQAGLRPVVVGEDSVYSCIAVARAAGVVRPEEPVLLVAARQSPTGGPRVDVRRLETPSGLAIASQNTDSKPACVHYALSADTLNVLREHFPDLLESLRESVSMLGGISAKDVRSASSDLNLDVVCSGGTALALAVRSPGGLVLGLHGDSIAAPLICPSLSSAAVLAQGCRACLVSRGLALDFLLLSVCLQACALLILYAERATITDGMHLYLEVIACGAPTIALALPGRTRIATIPPRLDAPALVIHILSWLSAQVCLLGQLHCRSWYDLLTRRIQRRIDATVVFLLAAFQLPLLALLLATLRGGLRPMVLCAAILLPMMIALTLLLFP
ncbi:unnamed protein product, partial [Ixodes hexagonus]